MESDKRQGFYVDVNGLKIFVESFNSSEKAVARVLCLPGIGNYGWYFEPLAMFLNEIGISVYSTDYRGTGLSEGPRWDIPSTEIWVQDIKNIVENLPETEIPTFLLGHSLGGALALNSVIQLQETISGLIVIAPAMTVEQTSIPWVNYFIYPIGMVFAPHRPLVKIPYPSMEEMIRNHADEDLASRLQTEPYRLVKMSTRGGLVVNTIKKLTNAEKAAHATKLPVLVVCGEDDSALKGAIRYFDNLSSVDKELMTLPSEHHHLLRGVNRIKVYKTIADWINKQEQVLH